MLWISGGASRADVSGQIITRAASWIVLIVFIFFGQRPALSSVKPVAFFILASAILLTLQLLPLPPSVWTALPGRQLLEQAATVTGQDQPWRPLSISPGWTVNALSSLIVPATMCLLLAALATAEHWRMLTLLLGLIIASSLLGLLQFSGGHFDHPLINDVRGSVSASFANRNHFALFAAFGCILAPAWAFREERRGRWRIPIALALLMLFALIILATGSRTGMLLGALAICLGLLNVRLQIRSELNRLPRRTSLVLIGTCVVLLVTAIALSISLGRAVSLDRAFALDAGEDLRRLALPTVWEMAKLYFPFGSGIGTFDPVYRIHEPENLLSFNYFNHAHNDFLEIILDAGLPGLILLLGAVVWWLVKSLKAWRSKGSRLLLPRIGSMLLFLTFLASITDYPARTPMIMAIVVIAAVWLNGSQNRETVASLAGRDAEI